VEKAVETRRKLEGYGQYGLILRASLLWRKPGNAEKSGFPRDAYDETHEKSPRRKGEAPVKADLSS
jgi:hypothetical protein